MTGVVLALDVGGQRIGVALSDPEQRVAVAHSIVPAQPPAEARKHLAALAASEGANRIVVGLPRTLEGSEGPQARTVRAFAEALGAATGLPLEFVDERFTSRDAEAAAAAKGTAPDAEAARLILEIWIDRQRTSP